MFHSIARSAPIHRMNLEQLESREMPANIAAIDVSLQTATMLRLTYQATGATRFTVGIYRSADPVLSADDVRWAGAGVMAHSTNLRQSTTIPLRGEIPIDPARPYVLAVVDPNNSVIESDETDNTATFRKLSLSVVAHGLELNGTAPPWLAEMADELRHDGFERVIAFDWAATSRIPAPGLATLAGIRLAQQVRLAADEIGTLPTDVIDVQFIGHSRGGVVISQALSNLQLLPGPRELRLGYFQMTMLDPHPARNSAVLGDAFAELLNGAGTSLIGGFSFNASSIVSRNAARAMVTFQAAARDPLVIVPANVDRAELFHQRQPWFETLVGSFEYLIGLNPWGESPTSIINRSNQHIMAVDVSKPPINSKLGHGVQFWYLDEVLRA